MNETVFDNLDNLIMGHSACNNDFFYSISKKKMNPNQVRAFAPDYFFWVKSFPGILAGLIYNINDTETQFYLSQILFSELGSGFKDKMHFKLLADTFKAVGLSDIQINTGPQYQETKDLVNGMHGLYSNKDFLLAMGAQYALEKQAFPMIENLYKGFKNFTNLSKEDFEYFELHLTEEPEHLKFMQDGIVRLAVNRDDIERTLTGASKCLDLIANFWERQFIEFKKIET